LDEARKEKEEAERALAEMSIAFRHEQARSQPGFKEVTASISKGTGLVAFVRYNRHKLGRPAANEMPPEPVSSYLAFVLQAGANNPAVVPLGTAKEIEALVAAWHERMTEEAMLAVPSFRQSEAAYQNVAVALRKRIWDPVAARLASTRRVFVVPDGALYLVNLASLPVGYSSY